MAEASSSSSSQRVPAPAPQRVGAVAVVALLLLVLVLLRAPCGGASRPVREGTSDGTPTVAWVRALDGGHHRASESVAMATGAARRASTVGSGAPTPPYGPSQNHN